MDENHQDHSDEIRCNKRATPREAFDQATLDLAMEGIHIDPEQVPPLTAYRNRMMTFAEACEAMRKRHMAG